MLTKITKSNSLLSCMFCLASLQGSALLAQESAQIKQITFAFEGAYPPLSMIDEHGQHYGLEHDVYEAICRELQDIECSYVLQPFDSLFGGLKVGMFDVVMAGLAVTEERLNQFYFSDAYMVMANSFAVKASTFSDYTPKSLEKKRIGVQVAGVPAEFIYEHYGKSRILEYETLPQIWLDLKAGRLDAAFDNTFVLRNMIQNDPKGESFEVSDPIEDRLSIGSGIAAMMNNTAKGEAIQMQLNQALAVLKEQGVLEDIVARWNQD